MSESDNIVSEYNNASLENKSCMNDDTIVLYRKRWIILVLFTSYSFSNAYQWIHLNIISERVMYFWNNSLPTEKSLQEQAINWLSLVYMLVYIPLIIPAMWFLKHKGLRSTSIIASFLNAIGAWIKCAAVTSNGSRFAVLMTGQTICAIAQIFILGIPAHLAALWFGVDEVSTATSLGVFGNQLGNGFGFLIPPLIFPRGKVNETSIEVYQTRFNIMFYTAAALMTVLCILIFFTFSNKPKTPPSRGQMALAESSPDLDYKTSIVLLIKDNNFVLLFFSYGINCGIFYGFSTLLSVIIQSKFKNETKLAGLAGLLMIVFGIIAAVIIGIILDKTKAFKTSIIVIYLFSALSMMAFTAGLYFRSWEAIFLTMILLGFFSTAYLPLGFEFAAEMTYPINEGLTSGLLNLSAQVFGIIFTYVGQILIDKSGAFYTNLSFIIGLMFGMILTLIMKIDLKRQRANLTDSEKESLRSNSSQNVNYIH